MAGLLILKHMQNLSDEALCARWVENPYYQYICGEESFCHALAFDRSSLTRWRQRLGEERRTHLDKGCRGHTYPNKFRVWISGQVRRVTKSIRREMRRRAAVEPVIGHVKAERRMDRNYLKGRDGDRANAVLAAAGYNFSLLIRWFETLLRALIAALKKPPFAAQIT